MCKCKWDKYWEWRKVCLGSKFPHLIWTLWRHMVAAILDYVISMKTWYFERELNLFHQIHPLHPFVMLSTHQVNREKVNSSCTTAANGGYMTVTVERVNTNAGPSAVLTTPATFTISIHSPTDTSLCIISIPTYVGQRVVCCAYACSSLCAAAPLLCKDAPRPLQQNSFVACCLRSLTKQFAWDFLGHFALKHDVFMS